jgi:WD40 repeat protein
LFVQVCQAVQHAHQKGIIHRDLKPNNVLVAQYDGKPVPKVIDFGVAKATGQQLTERTMFTGFGDVIGTLEYMSPEQAELNQLDVDTRSDIYSLGVLLYELLTGSTPLENKRVRNAALLEVLRVVREEEPPRPSTRLRTSAELPSVAASRGLEPRKLSGLVKGELDWIVMKALEKDRSRRYETANGLAMDLQRYLADEAVHACPPTAGYRFRKFARRNRRTLVTVSVFALAALVGVGALAVSSVLVLKANQGLKESVERERLAADRERLAKDQERLEAYFQRITVAHRELSIGNVPGALRALEACPEELRGWEWHYLMRLRWFEPKVLQDVTEVMGLAFSPDGERLASAGGDGTIKIWNSRTDQDQVLQKFSAHTGSALSVAFHPHGNHVASVGADQQVKVWDLATPDVPVFTGPCNGGDVIRKFGSACTVAFSPDGRLLAAGSDGAVTVWDWKSREVLHTFPGHQKNAISVAFSRDGRRLASASTGEAVNLWELEGGGPSIHTFIATAHPVSALAFSPDGGWLAEASLNRKVRLWDTATRQRQPLHIFPHDGAVQSVAFSADARSQEGRKPTRLASAGADKTVYVWDTTTGRELLGLDGHAGPCGCVAFSPDGHRLASASKDKTIRIWDATPLRGDESQAILTFTGHDDQIRSVALGPDGRVASAAVGTGVKVWDGATREVSAKFELQSVTVFCLAWQPPAGRQIASSGWDGRRHTVWIWDPSTGDPILPHPLPLKLDEACFVLTFSPDGRYLVTGHGNGDVKVWDARTGREVNKLGTHDQDVRGAVFSNDGKHLASASTDGVVKLWDATRLEQKQDARRFTDSACVPASMAFSPDGKWLAAGGEDHTIKVWDVQTRYVLQTIRGHKRDVCTVAFSPNGRWMASGSADSTVKVWDTRNAFGLVRDFRDHTGLVCSVVFGPDHRRLYSGSDDHTVKVWDLTELGEVAGRQQVQPTEKVPSSQGSDR